MVTSRTIGGTTPHELTVTKWTVPVWEMEPEKGVVDMEDYTSNRRDIDITNEAGLRITDDAHAHADIGELEVHGKYDTASRQVW